ncbi:hypothetical protein [Polynucleobacter necessarius]
MHDTVLNPLPWVKRFAPMIPKPGLVLGLAYGAGDMQFISRTKAFQ